MMRDDNNCLQRALFDMVRFGVGRKAHQKPQPQPSERLWRSTPRQPAYTRFLLRIGWLLTILFRTLLGTQTIMGLSESKWSPFHWLTNTLLSECSLAWHQVMRSTNTDPLQKEKKRSKKRFNDWYFINTFSLVNFKVGSIHLLQV